MRNRTFLVAGGTGLVGMNLTKRLHTLGAQVRASYCTRQPPRGLEGYHRYDFTRFEDCLAATRDIDGVFLCLGQVFGAKRMQERPTAYLQSDLQMHAGLLEACRINRVQRVVLLSSSTVYQEARHPIREEELDLNQPPYPLYFGIGWMKRYLEQLARLYHLQHGVQVGIVRPTNIYGPWDRFDEDHAHVVPALIRRAEERQEPFVVWGDGSEIRDFLFVEDVVEDLCDVMERGCTGEPLNLASGTGTSIRELVDLVLDVCGHHTIPQYDATKPTAIPYRLVSAAKYEALRGRRVSRTPLRAGMTRTVEWYRATMAARQSGSVASAVA